LSSSAVRMILRPMRPKPLMPTLMGILPPNEMSATQRGQMKIQTNCELEIVWAA
jgi:hypothetical protein